MSSADVSLLSQRAGRLDQQDPLSPFRDRFVIQDDFIYLDGNSLGRLPVDSASRISDTVTTEWGSRLVLGWDKWIDEGTRIGNRLAPLIGAMDGEVAIADQTSINLYKLATAGLAASGKQSILTDSGNFPSDRYVLASVAHAAGGRLVLTPEDPTLTEIEHHLDESIGLVSLSHVAYRSGAMCDGAKVTDLAHSHGALMLWDLAHSAGSVPVDLGQWRADLAIGCTYKYLNAGPGAPGFLYVRQDLQSKLDQPITGWFGHIDQFGFADEWVPAGDLRRFLVGTPAIVSMVGVGVGIDITAQAGIDAIRDKSLKLSSLFLEAIEPLSDRGIRIVTPLDPLARGSHITVSHPEAFQIATALRDRSVIPDFRAPNLIRFGFTPLYTTFSEVVRAAAVLEEILTSGAHETYLSTPSRVT